MKRNQSIIVDLFQGLVSTRFVFAYVVHFFATILNGDMEGRTSR